MNILASGDCYKASEFEKELLVKSLRLAKESSVPAIAAKARELLKALENKGGVSFKNIDSGQSPAAVRLKIAWVCRQWRHPGRKKILRKYWLPWEEIVNLFI